MNNLCLWNVTFKSETENPSQEDRFRKIQNAERTVWLTTSEETIDSVRLAIQEGLYVKHGPGTNLTELVRCGYHGTLFN